MRPKFALPIERTDPGVPSHEWHFTAADIQKEHDGKIYSVGLCVREIQGETLIAVGEVLIRNAKTGQPADSLICASVSEAIKFVDRLGREIKKEGEKHVS